MKDYITIYMTCGSAQEAETIAQALVERKLVACATILPAARSIYRWQGKMEAADEVVVLAKSRKELFAKIEACVKGLHSYSCPCIVAWPMVDGHQPYMDWIKSETVEP